ncbi:MAG: glutamate 5-kinase, partial [Rubricella sp.]
MSEDRISQASIVVVKIGSALLVDQKSGMLREGWLDSLIADVAALKAEGKGVVLVSSGSIALGRGVLGLGRRAPLEEVQAAAAVGQIRLARAYQERLAPHGITCAQVLLTLEDTQARRRYLNARETLSTLLRMGAVPI